jgi:hypothetical protein
MTSECSQHTAATGRRVDGWTLVLRRQPARIIEGRPEGGYTDAFELICCDCGDDPDRDYRGLPSRLQLIRGPYPIAAGVAAYQHHSRLHQELQVTWQPRMIADACSPEQNN